MYVVWKSRALSASHPCEWCGDRGLARTAYIPHLVESRRVDGRPRQTHIARLPSIRSCCVQNARVLRTWWQQVDRTLESLRRNPHDGRPLTEANVRAIRLKIAERLSRVGSRTGADRRGRTPRADSNCPRHLAGPLHVLGLPWPCRADEVKAAFRKRAKQTHPDSGGRAEEFRAVHEAYTTLLKALPGPLR